MKNSVTKFIAVAGLSAVASLTANADSTGECFVSPPCPTPEGFFAKGSETCSITIGGNITTGYQYVDLNDEISENRTPEEYNNFNMKHIRLDVNAHLGNGWSGLMNVDFAGEPGATFTRDPSSAGQEDLESSCLCKDQCKVYVNKAYIQKVWLDATFRLGYQKVNFGAEENTPEAHLKAIERSVATNFFTNLGRRANSGTEGAYKWAGQRLGGRHVGIFGAGQAGAFHYSGAVTNGYQGICCNSDDLNNSLNFYGSVAFEFGIDCFDFLVGVNGSYSEKGSNDTAITNHNVYAFNPYVFATYDRFNVMAELLWGSVENGKVTAATGDADPWGFNAIGSYMLNDNWELVGRFSYVNSDEMGMTIHNSFGCAPDVAFGANSTFVSSNVLFEKVYAGYVGVNYYMMNGAVKAAFGLEQAKFKNRADILDVGQIRFDTLNNKGAKVNAVRASLQLLF